MEFLSLRCVYIQSLCYVKGTLWETETEEVGSTEPRSPERRSESGAGQAESVTETRPELKANRPPAG